jgi:8-oxo-dGTP pyrophosphatase MutT (NUDIX family)
MVMKPGPHHLCVGKENIMARKGNHQIAAIPVRMGRSGIEVLLITSRETKRWVIPKGWPMAHLKDFNAAKVEAYEEAGVRGRITRKPVGEFRYAKILKSGEARPITVTVYKLHVETMLPRWPEKVERKRKWFTAEDAAKLVAEPDLKKLLLQLKTKK